MSTYRVTSSIVGSNREIGEYDSIDAAISAARDAGAVIPRTGARTEVGLSLRGYQRCDDRAIWIERIEAQS